MSALQGLNTLRRMLMMPMGRAQRRRRRRLLAIQQVAPAWLA